MHEGSKYSFSFFIGSCSFVDHESHSPRWIKGTTKKNNERRPNMDSDMQRDRGAMPIALEDLAILRPGRDF
jgi:hypothetical protein